MDDNHKNLITILDKIKKRKTNEKRINYFLNSFFNIVYEEDKLLFSNLSVALELVKFLLNNLDSYIKSKNKDINYDKVSQFSFLDKITIIDDFYKSLGIDFDIHEIVNNGIFNPYIVGYEEDEVPDKHTLFNGYMGYNNHKPSINVYDNDLITDAIIWVHEISHYFDLPKQKSITPVRELLTESLAFAYEFIFLDYLDNLGYSYESSIYKLTELKNFHGFLEISNIIIKLYLVYDKLGEVSRENYLLYFGYDDDYDKTLDFFASNILNTKEYNRIYTYLYYSLATALSIYMYTEYEKNHSFINNIINMQNNLECFSFQECLKTINLDSFDKSFFDKIKDSINDFTYEIDNGSDKIIASTVLTNDYFEELIKLYYEDKSMAFDKVNDILSLVKFLKYHVCNFLENYIPVFEYDKFSKYNKKEKIDLINSFYRYIGSDFRLTDDILNRDYKIETINPDDYIEDNDITLLINKIGSGASYYDEHRVVDVYDSGLLYDSITWVHESKHYHNQPDGDRSQISYVLTESLSFTEELIYTDFLKSLGYTYESYISKFDTFCNFGVFIEDAFPMIKMLSVYVNKGEISKQNYEQMFNDDEYENEIDEVLTLLSEDAEDFFNLIRYPVASALSIYMYMEYKKDKKFIDKINEFENSINNKDLLDCLSIIGLNGLNSESMFKIQMDLNDFKNELVVMLKENVFKIENLYSKKLT